MWQTVIYPTGVEQERVLFRLSEKELFARTELLALARESYCVALELLNTRDSGSSLSIDSACARFAETAAELRGFAGRIAKSRVEAFECMSENWQKSEQGRAALEWIFYYASFDDKNSSMPLTREIMLFGEIYFTDFEELPDKP